MFNLAHGFREFSICDLAHCFQALAKTFVVVGNAPQSKIAHVKMEREERPLTQLPHGPLFPPETTLLLTSLCPSTLTVSVTTTGVPQAGTEPLTYRSLEDN